MFSRLCPCPGLIKILCKTISLTLPASPTWVADLVHMLLYADEVRHKNVMMHSTGPIW
jgi:hypothetical protein